VFITGVKELFLVAIAPTAVFSNPGGPFGHKIGRTLRLVNQMEKNSCSNSHILPESGLCLESDLALKKTVFWLGLRDNEP
jgi:hypothetical protein